VVATEASAKDAVSRLVAEAIIDNNLAVLDEICSERLAAELRVGWLSVPNWLDATGRLRARADIAEGPSRSITSHASPPPPAATGLGLLCNQTTTIAHALKGPTPSSKAS